jgi:putative endonuclease
MSGATITTSTDKIASDIAKHYLTGKGIEIIATDHTCEYGKADIIARDGNELVFAIVEGRRHTERGLPGFPEERITAAGRRTAELVALDYLSKHQHRTSQVRFDILSVIVTDEHRAFLRHHYDAYSQAGE